MSAVGAVGGHSQAHRRASGVIRFIRSLCGTPSGAVATSVVALLLLVAVVGPLIAPDPYAAQDIAARLQGPSLHHLLGTDDLGRDVLSRVIGGVRIAFEVGVPSIAIASLVGLAIGMTAAYAGGVMEAVAVVIMDTLQVFPSIVLALLVLSLFGPSLDTLVIVIGVSFVPNYARVSRALVLTTKEEPYIEATRVLGATRRRVIIQHLVPNVLAPIVVLMAMDIPFAIVAESGLSFLGLGVQPPSPSWGAILSEGFSWMQTSPWPVIAASAGLAITTLGLTLLADRLRVLLDPKAGRYLMRRI
jgi:peptide/nickel transport system permease protein